MKRSEVIKELLDSYLFQWGKRGDNQTIRKARKIIEMFEKEENLNSKTIDMSGLQN